MIHTMARSTTTNCKHIQVLCMMFGERRDGVKEMDRLRDAECSEESLTDISRITLASQISIWRTGEVIEVFTEKHLS